MDYEKRYKEALETARKLNSGEGVAAPSGWTVCEVIFPELQESEEERIKKSIHIYLDWLDGRKDCQPKGEFSIKDMIAWLEKQVEQKPDVKVEPKYHEGDWILNNVCFPVQIASIKDGMYIFTEGDAMSVSFVDENYHLWTIAEAKDGDVLAYNDSKNNVWICIFKEYVNERIYDYCTLDKENFWEYGNWNYLASFSYKPATKEQRDLLFQKMKEAGYEWNEKKKELKKLEKQGEQTFQQTNERAWLYLVADVLTWKDGIGQYLDDPRVQELAKKLCSQYAQKLYNSPILSNSSKTINDWTEEDSKAIDKCCLLIGAADDSYEKAFKDDCIHYLQNLKQRMEE